MAKLNKIMPPRRVDIRGQDHLLAYITPDEAALLKARGGSGEPGPMGIPQYGYGGDDGGGGYGDGDSDSGSGTDGAGSGGGGGGDGSDNAADDEMGDVGIGGFSGGYGDDVSSGPSGGGMSPGRSQAQFGTTEFAGLSEQQAQGMIGSGQASQQAMDVQASLSNQKAAEIAALEQLNRDLYDLSRREQKAKSIPGLIGLIAQKNVRNLAASLVGYEPGLLSGLNVFSGNPIGPGLDPSALAGLQSRGIRGATGKDPFGRDTTGIVGFRDSYGNVAYGRDPNDVMGEGGDGYGGRPQFAPVNPATGQCDAGYMFDEDMQACRLDTGYQSAAEGGGAFGEPGERYARMGLLDVAPAGLPQFQQQYGAGFGSPSEFDVANAAFRYGGAYEPSIFKNPYPTTGMQQVKLLS